jgi:putative sterol carrier protein
MGESVNWEPPGAGDPISQFFATLAAPGRLATFYGESATLRFDVRDNGSDEQWHLAVTDGDVVVTHDRVSADVIVSIGRSYFEAMVTGRLNAQAAILRGLLDTEGSMAALMMFQRCLPGPPGSTGRVAPIPGSVVMAEHRPGGTK